VRILNEEIGKSSFTSTSLPLAQTVCRIKNVFALSDKVDELDSLQALLTSLVDATSQWDQTARERFQDVVGEWDRLKFGENELKESIVPDAPIEFALQSIQFFNLGGRYPEMKAYFETQEKHFAEQKRRFSMDDEPHTDTPEDDSNNGRPPFAQTHDDADDAAEEADDENDGPIHAGVIERDEEGHLIHPGRDHSPEGQPPRKRARVEGGGSPTGLDSLD